MDLANIEPQKVSTDLASYTSFLFGPPKAGKTTFYHQLFGQRAVFAMTEKGAKAVAGLKGQGIGSWSDFMKFIRQLKRKEVKELYDVVIIDTFDNLCMFLEKFIKNKYDVDKLNDANGGWGAGQKEFTETLFMALNEIEKLGYTVHFVSHANIKTEKIPGTDEEYEKYIPSAPKRGIDVATKMVDNILFSYLGINPETKKEQRVLYTRETLNFQAGSRFKNLEPALPMDANAYKEAMVRAIEAEGPENLKDERDSGQVVESEELDFDTIMKQAKELGLAMHNANRMPEVTEVVEKHFGKGKLLKDATKAQVETLKLAVDDLQELVDQNKE